MRKHTHSHTHATNTLYTAKLIRAQHEKPSMTNSIPIASSNISSCRGQNEVTENKNTENMDEKTGLSLISL